VVESWFEDNLCREVEDGKDTLFVGSLVGSRVFKCRYNRSFYLVDNKMAPMYDMFSPGSGKGGKA